MVGFELAGVGVGTIFGPLELTSANQAQVAVAECVLPKSGISPSKSLL